MNIDKDRDSTNYVNPAPPPLLPPVQTPCATNPSGQLDGSFAQFLMDFKKDNTVSVINVKKNINSNYIPWLKIDY